MGIEIARFVQPSQAALNGVTCAICLDVMDDPHSACPKEHSFCKKCLDAVIGSRTCPTCRRYSPFKAKPSKGLARVIGEFEVTCANRSAGCWWRGPLSSETSHLQFCAYALVSGQSVGCPIQYRRKDSLSHVDTCEFELVRCSRGNGCGRNYKRGFPREHDSLCEQFTCLNRLCTTRGTRSSIASHRSGCDALQAKLLDLQLDNDCQDAELHLLRAESGIQEATIKRLEEEKRVWSARLSNWRFHVGELDSQIGDLDKELGGAKQRARSNPQSSSPTRGALITLNCELDSPPLKKRKTD